MNNRFRLFQSFEFLILTCFMACSLLCSSATAFPSDEEEQVDSVRYNAKASGRLSAKLSTKVKVFDTDWFQIVVSSAYAESVAEVVAPNVVNAVAEFCHFFGADPRAPFWSGGKGRLVFLQGRKEFQKYVSIIADEAESEGLDAGFAEDAQFAQSFFRLKPAPLAAACGEDADYNVVVQHVFHLLGHILLTGFEFNQLHPPAWLHEGYAEYVAMRYAGGNILYCTPGLNNNVFGTGVFSHYAAWARSELWIERFKQSAYLETALTLGELGKLPIDDFTHPDAAQAWSFTTFLIEEHPAEFKQYVLSLKKPGARTNPDGPWTNSEYAAELFGTIFGKEFDALGKDWISWAEKVSARWTEVDSGTGKRTKRATVRFDPCVHLEGYMELAEKGDMSELASYEKRSGKWIRPSELKKIRAEWGGIRGEVNQALVKARTEQLTQEVFNLDEVMARVVKSKSAQFLNTDEVGGLIRPGVEESVFRSVVSLFVNSYGCRETWSRLEERIGKAAESLKSSGLDRDVDLLEQAAAFETQLIHDLVGVGASLIFDFWPGKLELKSFEGDTLVLKGKALKGKAATSLKLPEGCEISHKEDSSALRYPLSLLDMDKLIKTAKKALKIKDDEEARLGFAQLLLFSGDAKACRKELKYVNETRKEKNSVNRLIESYEHTLVSVDLLNLFLGRDPGTIVEKHKKLFSLLDKVKGSPLMKALHSRGKGVASRILLEHYFDDNRFLRSFNGFQGLDHDAGVRFKYTFDSPSELDDFIFDEPALVAHLVERHELADLFDVETFQVMDGELYCYGTDFITLKPIFNGDIRVRVRLRVSLKDGYEGSEGYYTLFGYGLDEVGGYIASSCLAYFEHQDRIGEEHTPKQLIDDLGNILGYESYDSVIHGTEKQVVVSFDEQNGALDFKGHRKGQVFLWVFGEREFHIEEIEIIGTLDSLWLQACIEKVVDQELARAIE